MKNVFPAQAGEILPQPEFNLLDEKWIRVLCRDCSVKEVSLTEALVHAHEYKDLAGELKTQDVAVLRLMLAVLHTVFSRVDGNGAPGQIEDEPDALSRWGELWQRGRFPEGPIREYLEAYRDRFCLFHPEYPFYQVPEAAKGSEFKASKLNGELSESSDKLRLFPSRTGEPRNAVTYAEAARWLLYINGFDDSSLKPKGKGLPSPGVGWLGKLGLVCAVGDSLFRTLMLNLVLLKNAEEVWEEDRPEWELPSPRSEERKEIAVPDNPAEILTLQSRRLLLHREGAMVNGYSALSGDFFAKENAFAEQMTEWKEIKEGKGLSDVFQPRRHDGSRQMWRDFESLAVQGSARRAPGVVRWVARLRDEGLLPEDAMVSFRASSVRYGAKNSSIADESGDSLSFAAALLTAKGKAWQDLVVKEVAKCEKRAYCLGNFARDLARAGEGGDKEQAARCRHAQEEFYYRLDIPFREWLAGLKPWQGGEAGRREREEWNEKADAIARRLGKEMADKAGPGAFVGRTVGESGKARHYSTPEALNRLMAGLKKIEEEG